MRPEVMPWKLMSFAAHDGMFWDCSGLIWASGLTYCCMTSMPCSIPQMGCAGCRVYCWGNAYGAPVQVCEQRPCWETAESLCPFAFRQYAI